MINDYNREMLRIEVDISLTGARITRVLEQLVQGRGRPERLRVDRGPEFNRALAGSSAHSKPSRESVTGRSLFDPSC